MWLQSVYFKTLRDHRTGALAWGIGPGLLMAITLTQFEQLVGSPEQRGALVALAQQFAWYESAEGITRPGGFVTFRLGPLLWILPSVWALLAASRQLRGEEERGALDLVLATPVTRTRVMLEKLAALGTALVVLALLLGTIVAAAGAAGSAEFTAPDAYVFALNVALTAGVYGAIALLLSQLFSERSTVAGLTGGFLALSFMLRATAHVAPGFEWLAYLSPLYYAGLTKPLVPEVGVNPAAMVLLAVMIAVCAGAAALLFTRRDLGFALRVLPPRTVAPRTAFVPYAAGGGWSLRSPFWRALRVKGGPALWWALGAGAYAAWMTAVGRQLQDNLTAVASASPALSAVFARLLGPSGGGALFLNMLVFTFVPVALAALAISDAERWASDEEERRTDMLLAQPVSRARAMLSFFAAAGLAQLGVTLVLALAVGSAARAVDLPVDTGHLLAACLGIAPVLYFLTALGALLNTWLRGGTTASLLGAYVVLSFVLSFIGPIFQWPAAVIALSIFDAYGAPLVDGWQWGPLLALLAASAAVLAAAAWRFQRMDLAR